MRRIRLSFPSPAIVISVIAVVAALGGTAYAASGSGSRHATAAKVSKGFVRTTATSIATTIVNTLAVTIADNEITKAAPNLNVNHAKSADTATTAGSASSAGTAGTANALNGVQIVRGPDVTAAANTFTEVVVNCPSGKQAIGGGEFNNGGTEASFNDGFITNNGGTNNAYDVTVNDTTASTFTFHAWVICISGSVSGSAS